ncbi:PAS domain S-box protein [Candidatus Latescibacterota bacterium]
MSKSKILIVEDEYLTAKSIEKDLENHDYSVTGRDAIKQVKKHEPDLILMDIKLKDNMNGIEVADKIRKKYDIPIIYITAHDDTDYLEKAKITYPFGYLMKPIRKKQLLLTIEMALYKHNLDKENEELLNTLHQTNEQLQEEISERKKTENALRESEERYRSLFESAPEFIHILDANGVIMQINADVILRSGYTQEDMIGSHITEFFTPASREIFDREFPFLINQGINFMEVKFVCKDGAFIDMDSACRVVHDDLDEIEYIVMFQRDITRRRLSEEALQENEEGFKELAELLPQPIFELDLKGNFTYTNRHGFESTGYTQKDFRKGISALQMFVPEDRERVKENMEKVLKGEKFKGHEYTILRKSGSTFAALIYSSAIIRDNEPVGIRGIVLDISEHKKS